MSNQGWLYLFLSFLFVGLAQPDWSALFCILAAASGYALFWKSFFMVEGRKKRFFLALVWFGGVQALHLNWFMADRYVGWPIYFFLLLLFGVHGVFFALWSLCIPQELRLPRLLALAAAWTLFEWSRLYVLSGDSWDPMGLALSATLWGRQMGAVAGLFGMTFWVALTNLLALRVRAWRSGVVWALVAVVPYAYGAVQVALHVKRLDISKRLEVVAVQTAFLPEEKVAYQGEEGSTLTPLGLWRRILAELAPHYGTSVDLIALPESAVPYGTDVALFTVGVVAHLFDEVLGASFLREMDPEPVVGNAFVAQAVANAFHADVVAGFEHFDRLESGVRAYNAAFLFTPGSARVNRYEKRVLVPMGEYIPFAWCKKILSKYGIHDSFVAGTEARVFEGKRCAIGLSICYEETFGEMMRANRKKGADLLVNVTNDVWYPRSRLPRAHFLHGRMRTVEMGIPLVRACNTGVTCGVDSLGRVVAALPEEGVGRKAPRAALRLALPTYTYPTFYGRFGDRPVLGIALCLVAAPFFRKRFSFSGLKEAPLHENDDLS